MRSQSKTQKEYNFRDSVPDRPVLEDVVRKKKRGSRNGAGKGVDLSPALKRGFLKSQSEKQRNRHGAQFRSMPKKSIQREVLTTQAYLYQSFRQTILLPRSPLKSLRKKELRGAVIKG